MKKIAVLLFLVVLPLVCTGQKAANAELTIIFGESVWGSGIYYKILPDGSAKSLSQSMLPLRTRPGDLVLLDRSGKKNKPPKRLKLKDRLSPDDLRILRTEIDNARLLDLQSGLIGKKEGCPDDFLLSDHSGSAISLKIGGVVKQFTSFCEGSPGSTAQLYRTLYKHLYQLIKTVRVIDIPHDEFYQGFPK